MPATFGTTTARQPLAFSTTTLTGASGGPPTGAEGMPPSPGAPAGGAAGRGLGANTGCPGIPLPASG